MWSCNRTCDDLHSLSLMNRVLETLVLSQDRARLVKTEALACAPIVWNLASLSNSRVSDPDHIVGSNVMRCESSAWAHVRTMQV